MSRLNDRANLHEIELRQVVNELIVQGPRSGVRKFSQDSLRYSGRDVKVIVESLCVHNSTWKAEFSKLLRAKRRPGREVRRLIEKAINDSSGVDPAQTITLLDVIKRRRTAVTSAKLVIESGDELRKSQYRRRLFAKLDQIQRQGTPVDLTISISCENANPHGLAYIAAWCERYAAKVKIEASSSRVGDYLQRTGFREIIEERSSINAPLYDEKNHVAITRIDRDEKARTETDMTAGRIVSLFANHTILTRSQRHSLGITFSEMIENVYRHAQSNFPGFVMAQAYPQKNRLQIEIIDTGIGIFDSFRKSGSPEYKIRAKDDVSSIELAVGMFVTSKQERHQGYGLYIVKRLVEKNRAKMMITSGKGTSYFIPEQSFASRDKRAVKNDHHQRWPGTGISLDFDLSQALEIIDVYREMPQIGDEDFFG